MMPLDSLITLPWLCFWTKLIMSQHPQTCRLPFSAQTEQHSWWMQSTLSLLQPLSLLHVRPLMLHFPCSNHTSGPWSLPTQLLALPWPKKCCAFLFPQLWWNWKWHTRSFQGPTNIFTGTAVRQRGLWLSQIISSGAAPKCLLDMQCNCRQMQLVCLPLPGSGRPAHICMSMLCYWACRNVVFIGTDLLGGPELAEILGRVS